MKQNDFYEVDGCMDFIPVKLIEEHKHMTNTLEVELTQTGYKTFVPIIYSFPIVNEPEKPVVPKFVAEWIEELKKSHSNLAWVWQVYPNETKIKNWLESNTEKFMRAWLDGYEVEQEKLYTVEIPSPNRTTEPIIYLSRDERGKIFLTSWFLLVGQNWKKHPHSHLTEAEIKEDFEWAWQFAKPVEEN